MSGEVFFVKLMRSASGEEGSARNVRKSMRRSAINVRSIGGMRSMRGNGDEMRQEAAPLLHLLFCISSSAFSVSLPAEHQLTIPLYFPWVCIPPNLQACQSLSVQDSLQCLGSL